MRGGRDIDDVAHQQQCGPLVLTERIVGDSAVHAAITSARCRGGQRHWTAEFLGARGQIERMETLKENRVGLPFFEDIQRAGRRINHGSARDANFGNKVSACHIIGRDGASVTRQERSMPVTTARVCVEGIHAVMLGGDVHDVARTGPQDVHACGHERLRIHVAVDATREHPFENIGPYDGRRENGFIRVRAGAEIIVVVRENAHLGVAVPR